MLSLTAFLVYFTLLVYFAGSNFKQNNIKAKSFENVSGYYKWFLEFVFVIKRGFNL